MRHNWRNAAATRGVERLLAAHVSTMPLSSLTFPAFRFSFFRPFSFCFCFCFLESSLLLLLLLLHHSSSHIPGDRSSEIKPDRKTHRMSSVQTAACVHLLTLRSSTTSDTTTSYPIFTAFPPQRSIPPIHYHVGERNHSFRPRRDGRGDERTDAPNLRC